MTETGSQSNASALSRTRPGTPSGLQPMKGQSAPRDPLDLRDNGARWGLRGFWLFMGCAASMIAGLLIPVLANPAFIVTMAFFIAAWICMMVTVFRLVQYGFARRGLSHRMSQQFGPAAKLPRAPHSTWWNRLSPFGKVIYLLGGLVFALAVTMAKPNIGDANFGARALGFVVLIGIITFGGRLISRR